MGNYNRCGERIINNWLYFVSKDRGKDYLPYLLQYNYNNPQSDHALACIYVSGVRVGNMYCITKVQQFLSALSTW